MFRAVSRRLVVLPRTVWHRLAILHPIAWLVFVGLAALALAAVWTVRLSQQYAAAATQLAVTQQRLDTETHRERILWQSLRDELNEIDRTLYAQPPPSEATPRRPSIVEAWQINRDKELRQRIHELELWRLAAESRLAALERHER